MIFLGIIEGLPAPDSLSIPLEGLDLQKGSVHISKQSVKSIQSEILAETKTNPSGPLTELTIKWVTSRSFMATQSRTEKKRAISYRHF